MSFNTLYKEERSNTRILLADILAIFFNSEDSLCYPELWVSILSPCQVVPDF